jgi:hypothetical protein
MSELEKTHERSDVKDRLTELEREFKQKQEEIAQREREIVQAIEKIDDDERKLLYILLYDVRRTLFEMKDVMDDVSQKLDALSMAG